MVLTFHVITSHCMKNICKCKCYWLPISYYELSFSCFVYISNSLIRRSLNLTFIGMLLFTEMLLLVLSLLCLSVAIFWLMVWFTQRLLLVQSSLWLLVSGSHKVNCWCNLNYGIIILHVPAVRVTAGAGIHLSPPCPLDVHTPHIIGHLAGTLLKKETI